MTQQSGAWSSKVIPVLRSFVFKRDSRMRVLVFLCNVARRRVQPSTPRSMHGSALLTFANRAFQYTKTLATLLAGEGKVFSAGHNLKEMTSDEASSHQRIFDTCNRLMAAIIESPVPVIAAVNGVAAAAGCQLVAMCDISVATSVSR